MNALPPPGTADPLDGTDEALLSRLGALVGAADPMPADLVPRIQFALALENVDVEVCRLGAELGRLAGVRGDETSRTVTFDSESATIMVVINGDGGGVRLDGWIAPPAGYEVELRTDSGPFATRTDADGRFVLDGIPHGLAQLMIRPTDRGGPNRPVVTPSIVV